MHVPDERSGQVEVTAQKGSVSRCERRLDAVNTAVRVTRDLHVNRILLETCPGVLHRVWIGSLRSREAELCAHVACRPLLRVCSSKAQTGHCYLVMTSNEGPKVSLCTCFKYDSYGGYLELHSTMRFENYHSTHAGVSINAVHDCTHLVSL